jgi:hypothetical protein
MNFVVLKIILIFTIINHSFMKNIYLLGFLFLIGFASSQAQSVVFDKTYKSSTAIADSSSIGFVQVLKTADRGYVMLGNYEQRASPNYGDFIVVKMDSLGAVQWSKSYGTRDSLESAEAIRQTSDGGFVVCGWSGFRNEGDVLVMKINASGVVQWTKSFGSTDYDEAFTLEVLPNGKIIVAGKAYPDAASLLAGFVIQLDANGVADAAQFISKGDITTFQSSTVTLDGGVALWGSAWQIRGNTTGYDPFLVKLNANGTIAWGRRYNMLGSQLVGFHIKQTSDGGFIMAGSSVINSAHGFFVAKTNPSGDILWMKTYSSRLNERVYDIIVNSNKTYNLVGTYGMKLDVNGNVRNNGFQLQLDSIGGIKWSKTYGDTSAVSRIYSVIAANDGGFTLAGETFGFGNTLGGGVLIHTDARGNIGSSCMALTDSSFTVGVTSSTDSIGYVKVETGDEKGISFRTTAIPLSVNQVCIGTPTSELYNRELDVRVFPNPVESDRFYVQVPKSSKDTRLDIFDMTGRLVYSLGGSQSEVIEVVVPNMARGMYLLKVVTDEGFVTKKFVY